MNKQQVYTELSKLTQAISSPLRMEIIDLLSQREFSVEEIAVETAQSVANTSSHLQVLKAAGLAVSRRKGNYVLYSVAGDRVLKMVAAVRDLGLNRIGGIGSLIKAYQGDKNSLESITLQELEERNRKRELILLDVRPAAEYDAGHIPGAVSLPLKELKERMHELPSNKTIVAYCRGPFCMMAKDAVQLLRNNNLHAIRMEDGFTEWKLHHNVSLN